MRDFIDKHSPDLFLIQETHLRPEYSFNIPNYIYYRNDRTNSARGWGGTAILIKRSIPHFHVPTPPLLTGVEATLVALIPSDQEPFLVASIYAPPNPNYRNLGADLDGIFKTFKSAFLAGDFNALHTSWGCVNSHPRELPIFAIPPPQLNTTWSIFTKILANPDNFVLPTANSTHEIDSPVSNLTSEILNAHASASRPFYHTEQPYVQDDTTILNRHRNLDTLVENINEHLAHLETWFSVWKIALNSYKTEAVFFSKRKPPPEITLQNQRISWSQHTKYLGVIIDKNLPFQQHITHIRDKFKDTTRKLYTLICRKSKLSRHNKLLIYTLILKPLLTYASPVWGHAAKTNINLLETSQNLIIRQICNAHWYMRNKDLRIACNIPTIRQTIRKLAINFFKNIDESNNSSINDVSPYFSHFSIKRPRDILVNPDFN
ncbi:RNA-directed DNA polymerase from mobile element jockey [Trichonephila clavipes]|nr:RNA-directed DNA polymerase from mobile element jockey [Trichonephila clavipes]